MKYIIVDDESIAHDIIKRYCSLLPDMEFMQDCYDAIDAIQYLKVNPVDLIFLDLNMPKLHGFDFLKTLSHPPKVIVTTAYKEFALEGYELNVVDYLLKPFSFERFLKAMNKTSLSSPREQATAQVNEEKEKIFLRVNNRYAHIRLDDILFVEAAGNYIKIVLTDQIITMRGKLSSLVDIIPQLQCIQVHRSFMVVEKHIKMIEGNQIFVNEYTIPIGKYYKAQIDRLLK